MVKLALNQPTLFMLYGFPGSGKTFFARQLSEDLKAAHIQADRIRHELFDEPLYDRQETAIVNQIVSYMCEEFIKAGVSVILDDNAARFSDRRKLTSLAKKTGAFPFIAWFQLDMESAFSRVVERDRRRSDDKYARRYDRTTFEADVNKMQNPQANEEYIVLSGKHAYQTHKSMIMKRLYDKGLLHSGQTNQGLPKPGLVNLVPNPLAGRVDPTRRNISIR